MDTKPTRVCEMCEGQPATVFYEMTELCGECWMELEHTMEADSDGQPDEAQEWADYDRDC